VATTHFPRLIAPRLPLLSAGCYVRAKLGRDQKNPFAVLGAIVGETYQEEYMAFFKKHEMEFDLM
jgi:hypothetical protein